ncbi:MAG: peptidoglycan editing factor PgeF [Legionellales bacterium]|jgi:polyphenol oxidase|nr:peptidoglycan editing factor PgeF [Legionellales bacterium]
MSKVIFESNLVTIPANWQAPEHITAFTTTRAAGFSRNKNYFSLNLAMHANDDKYAVELNRKKINEYIGHEVKWLKQKHTNTVIQAEKNNYNVNADAVFTNNRGTVCAVLTADCVPILLTDTQGTFVAAIHAGWKGLATNIIKNTIQKIKSDNIIAWIGPCICYKCYNIGPEVKDIFCTIQPKLHSCFSVKDNKFHANLNEISETLLRLEGVRQISSANLCTKNHKNDLFSARRDGINSGRIASCIWIK